MNTIFVNGVPVEQGSGNVYADLGYPDAEEMLVKAELVHQIQQTIDSRGLTQQQAAEQVGKPTAWLSDLLDGRFRKISEAEVSECLKQLKSVGRE